MASVAQQHAIVDEALPRTSRIEPARSDSTFEACPACELSLCSILGRHSTSEAERHAVTSPLMSSVHTVPARRTIFHPKEWSEFVPIICSGWSVSSIALPDGRRQILSFLLPGDAVSTAFLFGPLSGRYVEAVTEVTYRKFKRSDLRALLFENPDLFDRISKIWIEERVQADQLALDLGRRTASERIARQILNLAVQARHDARPNDGVSIAATPHRGRHGFDPRPCQQGSGRVPARPLDRDQQPLAHDPQ